MNEFRFSVDTDSVLHTTETLLNSQAPISLLGSPKRRLVAKGIDQSLRMESFSRLHFIILDQLLLFTSFSNRIDPG